MTDNFDIEVDLPVYEITFGVSDSDYDHGYRERSVGVNKRGKIFIDEKNEYNDEELEEEKRLAEKEMNETQVEIPKSMKPIYELLCKTYEFPGGNSSSNFDNEYLIGIRSLRALEMARKLVVGLEKQLELKNKEIDDLKNKIKC